MTRKEIDRMILLHESLRDRAFGIAKTILETKESNGQETEFIKAFLINKAMVQWLRELKADDE